MTLDTKRAEQGPVEVLTASSCGSAVMEEKQVVQVEEVRTSSRLRGFWGGWSGGAKEEVVVEETTKTTTITTTTTTTSLELSSPVEEGVPTVTSPVVSAIYAASLPSVVHKDIFAQMKAKIAEEAPEDNCPPYNVDDMLNRVLVARNLSVPDAFKMWSNIVAWRKEYNPTALTAEEAAPYLAKGVISMCGPDKNGRPCIFAYSKNHVIDAENHDANLRTIVNMLETATVESTEKADGFIAVIIDMDDAGRKNMDTHLFIGKPGLVQVLQEFYPERLGSCYIMHTSWIFRVMWAIISPFLDEKTRKKVHVLYKTEEILDHFDMATLPAELQTKLTAHAHAKK